MTDDQLLNGADVDWDFLVPTIPPERRGTMPATVTRSTAWQMVRAQIVGRRDAGDGS